MTTAQITHLAILALIRSEDREQVAGAVASMTLSGPAATQSSDTPASGWTTNPLPAGHYFNGHLIMTVADDNSRAYSDVYSHLAPAAHTMFSEEVRRIALVRMGAQPTAGRPAIGERVAVRLPEPVLARVDRFAASRNGGRARALRDLVEAGLTLLDPANQLTEEERAAMVHLASLAPVVDIHRTPASELVAPGWPNITEDEETMSDDDKGFRRPKPDAHPTDLAKAQRAGEIAKKLDRDREKKSK